MRFYDVNQGRITIDGVDIREIKLDALRKQFGLVLQDVYLFSGTIRENIRLGHKEIGDEEVRAAAASVRADRFIERVADGFDGKVAERGTTLSTGQRQLLSFARALAFAPDVLLLDEATSSVDTDTEHLIQNALRTLMRDRTTIAIAHRLSTIQNVDKIKNLAGPVYDVQHTNHFSQITKGIEEINKLVGPIYDVDSKHSFREILNTLMI